MTNPSRPLALADARLPALTILAESPIAPCRSLPEGGVMSNISDELLQIGQRLRSQDNRMNKSPIFQVRGKRRILGMDSAYCEDFEWIDTTNDFMIVEPPEDEDNPPDGIEKLYYIIVEEVLAVSFSEEGCKEHIGLNRNNYKQSYDEVFIYADSIWRCPEMLAIRKFLMSLPPPAEEQP
jgi:hypothetical protein